MVHGETFLSYKMKKIELRRRFSLHTLKYTKYLKTAIESLVFGIGKG